MWNITVITTAVMSYRANKIELIESQLKWKHWFFKIMIFSKLMYGTSDTIQQYNSTVNKFSIWMKARLSLRRYSRYHFGTNQQIMCDILYAINSNLRSIFSHFRDVANFLHWEPLFPYLTADSYPDKFWGIPFAVDHDVWVCRERRPNQPWNYFRSIPVYVIRIPQRHGHRHICVVNTSKEEKDLAWPLTKPHKPLNTKDWKVYTNMKTYRCVIPPLSAFHFWWNSYRHGYLPLRLQVCRMWNSCSATHLHRKHITIPIL